MPETSMIYRDIFVLSRYSSLKLMCSKLGSNSLGASYQRILNLRASSHFNINLFPPFQPYFLYS